MNWLAARTLACTLEWWAGANHVSNSLDTFYAPRTGSCTRYDEARKLCYPARHMEVVDCREMGSLGQSRCDFSPRVDWTCGR